MTRGEGGSKPNAPGTERGDERRPLQASGRRGNGETRRPNPNAR
ncbi:MAG TPA: hypothetical protein VN711_05250 [Candidatus Saccharimonadales bacterium]|nr:hypothetical protein [Candidatus Saccharimonadales bacterium]